MKGTKKPEPVGGPVGGVGDHARPVVLAEHGQDPGPDEQPQQVPAPSPLAGAVHARRGRGERAASSGSAAGAARRRPQRSVGTCALARRLRGDVTLRPRRASRRARRAAEHVHVVAEAHEQRAVERLLVDAPRSVSPGRIPRSARNRSISGSESETRTKRPRRPGSSACRLQVGRSSMLEISASGSDRRGGRASGFRAWPRSAPRAPRRARARAPRPRRGRDPRAPRGSRPDSSSSSRWWRMTSSATRRPSVGQRDAAIRPVFDERRARPAA